MEVLNTNDDQRLSILYRGSASKRDFIYPTGARGVYGAGKSQHFYNTQDLTLLNFGGKVQQFGLEEIAYIF
jgi:hypothetical protein